jgi:PAS domain S-box-containing protein
MATPDQQLTYINSAGRKMVGWGYDESLEGKKISDIHPKWAIDLVKTEGIPGAIHDGNWEGETAILNPDGKDIPVSQVIMSHKSPNGEVEYLSTMMRDITERKRAEDAIRESEEKFRSLAEQSPNMIFINKAGRVVYANKKCEERTGYEKEELYSCDFDFLTLIAPESLGLVKENFRKHSNGLDIPPYEYTIFNKAGEKIVAINSSKLIQYEGQTAILGVVTDITEKKQAEEALRESEERLRLAVQAAKLSTWDWNLLTDEVWLGGYSTEVLGLTPDVKSIPVSSFLERVNPEDLERTRQAVERAINEGSLYNEEYRIMRSDGTERWVAAQGQPVYDKTGKAIRVIGVNQDITERKEGEKALRISEEKFNKAFYSSPNAVTISTLKEGRFIAANEAVTRVLGYAPDEIIGKTSAELKIWALEEDRNKMLEMLKKSGKIQDQELQFRHKSGEIRHIVLSAGIIELEGEDCIVTATKDITERKRLEEAYRSLVDNSLQGLAIVQDGRVVFLNKAFYSTTDYSKEDFLNASPEQFQSIVHPDDRELVWSRHRDRLAGKPVPPRYDCRWIRKDGSTCWLELYASRIEYHGRPAIQVAYIDITERKQVEEALLKEKKFTEDAINAQMDTFFLFEPGTGKAIRWNKAFKDISGYTDGEIARMPAPTSYYSPEDVERAAIFIQKVLKEGAGTIELELICKDGRKVPTEYRVSLINDDQGEPKYIISIGRDLNERKWAEEAMNKSSIIIDSTADAVITTDIAGNITFWNKGAEKIYGYQKEEAIGKPVSILYKDQDLHVLEAMIADLLEGKDIPGIEATCIKKNQHDVEILLSLTSVRDEDGNITELVGITKDITERKKSEKEIERIFNMTDYMICIASLNGYFKRINSSFEQMLGYSSEELLKKPFFDFIHSDDKEKTKAVVEEKLSRGCQVIGFENRYRCKDGSYKWLSWTSHPVVDEGITYAIAYDVTDRKKAQEKLLEYQKQLKSLASELLLAEERERRRIATGVHDDIGQKLALAKLELQSMNEMVSAPDASVSLGHACELVDKAMQDARSLSFDLSNPVLYEVGFTAAVESLLTEQMMQKSDIKTEFKSKIRKLKLGQDMSIVLFQAVRELLTNVVKHANANKVKVCIDKSDHRVQVIVEDDGDGFDLLKLQSPDKKKGGFGLFNVRERLEYLGGSFDIESKPGQGTRVAMAVPLESGVPAS